MREGLAKGFQMSRGYSTALLILRQDSNLGDIQATATAKCISILRYTRETSVNYIIVIKHILDLQHGPYSRNLSHYVYCFEKSSKLPQMNQIIRVCNEVTSLARLSECVIYFGVKSKTRAPKMTVIT